MTQIRYNDKEQDAIFKINKINCSYPNSNKVVLIADNVVIPRGQVTVLLGPSGAGKSTLLESLGLMSKTVEPGSTNILFSPEKDKPGYPLEQMWDHHYEELSYKIRQEHFSFIFQSTNLMPNFSAVENVELTELIQKKEEDAAVYKSIKTMINELNIFSLKFDKKPFAFSGGERQRIAFARAVNPSFSILFGDEPTGNLDHFNSNKLMKFIREFIISHENKSSLIVTHNIDLALDFADRIIILTKTSDALDAPSTINHEFILDESVCKWNTDLKTRRFLKKEIELLLNQDTIFITNFLHLLKAKNCAEADYLKFKEGIISTLIDIEDGVAAKQTHEQLLAKLFSFIPESYLTESESRQIKEKLTVFFDNQNANENSKIIHDVIEGINDKKLKNKVLQRFFKDFGNESNQQTGKDTGKQGSLAKAFNPLVKLFMVLTGIVLSVVPLFNFIIDDLILSSIYKLYKKIVRFKWRFFSKIWGKFNDFLRYCFIAICKFGDSSMTIIDPKKNQTKNIEFPNDEQKLYQTTEIKTHEIISMPKYFKALFFKRESEELLGNNNKNLWLILIILLLTFLAIGFSSGSLEYLKRKMEDPFVKTVTATLPSNALNLRKARTIIAKVNTTDSLKKLYRIDTIPYFNARTIHFTGDMQNSPEFGIDGRTIPLNDPMLPIILDSDINEATGKGFIVDSLYNIEDYSIVITYEMRDKLRCSENPAFLFLKTIYEDSAFLVPVPVSAVVKSLPGYKTYFLMTPTFYKNLNNLGERFLFDPDNLSLSAFISIDSVQQTELKGIISDFFERNKDLPAYNQISLERFPYTTKSFYKISVSFNQTSEINQHVIKHVFKKLKSDPKIVEFLDKNNIPREEFVQTFYPNYTSRTPVLPEYLSVNFADLDEVDAFADFIKNEAGIKLEMSNIERMKNYNFVSKLTLLISILLIFFSVLMINLFLSNILRTHLNSIRMNIGTFKAFGINIHRIYQRMMFLYIIVPLIIALGLCSALGYTGLVYQFIQLISKYDIEKDLYFNLINYWTLASILILLVVNYFTFSRIIKDIFDNTPGDLIYDRSNKA